MTRKIDPPTLRRKGRARHPSGSPFDTVALVLQGGGALGSYQAGVIEGLMAAGIEPDWVAGISIGALNSAIIAGNPPETRLKQLRGFWETICSPATPFLPADALRNLLDAGGLPWQKAFSAFEAWRSMIEGQRGFFAPRGLWPWLGIPEAPRTVGLYSIAELKATLERFADFDRINHGPMRVSISAVDVESGNFVCFDNRHGRTKNSLLPEHFMASGALPPGFPPVEIDGHFYWDGGLVSNTPLSEVLDDESRHNTLVFQVDLWSARGELPQTVYAAQERMKEIQYSSRTRAITDTMRRRQHSRRLLRELLQLIPDEARRNNRWCAQAEALTSTQQIAVIHMIYRDKEWEGSVKDYEFGHLTMLDHWAAGLLDASGALAHRDWLALPPDGREFVTYDYRHDIPNQIQVTRAKRGR